MKKLLLLLLALVMLVAPLNACGSAEEDPVTTAATTVATTRATTADTEENGDHPGAVSTTAATTASAVGQTLTAPEALASIADYDAFTIVVSATEDSTELQATHAYQKNSDCTYYYYELQIPLEDGNVFAIEYLGIENDAGYVIYMRDNSLGEADFMLVTPTGAPEAFDALEDFLFYHAFYGMDYALGFQSDEFVKGEDTVISGRDCYTYKAKLYRLLGVAYDYDVTIAVDKENGLWMQMEGLFYNGMHSYSLKQTITSFTTEADLLAERIPAYFGN